MQTTSQPLEDETGRTLLSLKEAATIIGVSVRTIQDYVTSGKLVVAQHAHDSVWLDTEAVRRFAQLPRAVGRPRTRVPVWHQGLDANQQFITLLKVQLRAGQQQAFEYCLQQISTQHTHRFPGTVFRSIMQSQEHPNTVQIQLVWRACIMPPTEEREALLQSLRSTLAEVLAWETAQCTEYTVILHTS